MQNHSEQLNELFTALAKAQSELRAASKNAEARHGKFADLYEVIETSRPVLVKYGLSVSQVPVTIDGIDYLDTWLCHASGQWIKSHLRLTTDPIQKNPMHALGGSITYFRRYSYAAIIGMINDEDTDGNSYDEAPRYHPSATEAISEAQRGLLINLIGNKEELRQRIHEKYKIENISMLSRRQASEIIEALKNHKG